MPWKHDGKIAGQSHWGGNYDVNKIIFLDSNHTYTQDGDESCSVNSVYYIPEGVTPTQANLLNYRIWHRYWEEPPAEHQLVRGTSGVLIEYTPSANMTVNSFGIFEDNGDTTYTNDNFRIFNEAGIQIAFLGTGTIISNEIEKYGLSGHIRTGNMGSVPLQADKKYYFLFQPDSNQSSNAIPAMFYNEEGVIRQTYTASSDTETTTTDVSTWNNYITGNTNAELLSNFIKANQNDYMTWTYNNNYDLQQNKTYVRSNYNNNLNYPFTTASITNKEALCDLDNNTLFWDDNYINYHTIKLRTSTLPHSAYKGTLVLNQILNLNKNDWFIYGPEYNTGLTVGDIYTCNFDSISTFNTSQNEFALQFADLLRNIPTSGDEIFCIDAKPTYSCLNHIIINKGFTSYITTMTPLTGDPASGYATSGIYLLGPGSYSDIGQIYNNGIYFYNNNTLNLIYDQNMTTIVDIETVADKCIHHDFTELYTNYGSMSNFYSTTAQPQEAFLNTTFNDARYYLEINGQEVDTSST